MYFAEILLWVRQAFIQIQKFIEGSAKKTSKQFLFFYS